MGLTLTEWLANVRADWMKDALCAEFPNALFFPEQGAPNDEAACGRCLVTAECLDYVLRDPDACAHGVWAGTTAAERKRLKRGDTVAA